MIGLEELLGALADWIGLDLRKMSARRAAFVVAFYTLAGLALLVGGLIAIIMNLGNAATVFGGAVCALIGAAWIARIARNVVVTRRERRDGENR
jgi:hypothetical protein